VKATAARAGSRSFKQTLMDGHPKRNVHCDSCCSASRRCSNEAFPDAHQRVLATRHVPQAFRPWVPSLTRALRFQRAGRRTERIQVRVRNREYRFGLLPKCPTPRPSIATVGIPSRAFALSWEKSGRKLIEAIADFGHAVALDSKRSAERARPTKSRCRARALAHVRDRLQALDEACHSNSYPNMTRTRSRSLSLVNPKAPPT
jgi:hypothetical protein